MIQQPAFGAGAVSNDSIAYYYGGYLSNQSVYGFTGSPLMLNSLISYNMDNKSWQNNTYDQTPRAKGSIHYIPASGAGLPVYFGGVETMNGTLQHVRIPNRSWSLQRVTSNRPTFPQVLRNMGKLSHPDAWLNYPLIRPSNQAVVQQYRYWRYTARATRFLRRSDLAVGPILLQLVKCKCPFTCRCYLTDSVTCMEASIHATSRCTTCVS